MLNDPSQAFALDVMPLDIPSGGVDMNITAPVYSGNSPGFFATFSLSDQVKKPRDKQWFSVLTGAVCFDDLKKPPDKRL